MLSICRAALVPALLLSLTVATPMSRAMAQSQSAPDDTAQNKDHSLTADNQSRADADRHITADVRKALIADKSLSTYAHNVKVITVNGAVTLKGPVRSEDERQKVVADASSAAPNGHVVDALTVKQ